MFLFPTVRNEVTPDEQVQRMLFLHNVNFVISFAQFAHVSPLFNHTPSIKDASFNEGRQMGIALAPKIPKHHVNNSEIPDPDAALCFT